MPDTLEQKRILTLDLSGMVAGSKYRGEFEERIKRALRETKVAGNILLFTTNAYRYWCPAAQKEQLTHQIF